MREDQHHILDFEGVDEVEITAGTSADVSQFAIISDTPRKVKIAIISKTIVPAENATKDPCLAINPRQPTIQEIEVLYEQTL